MLAVGAGTLRVEFDGRRARFLAAARRPGAMSAPLHRGLKYPTSLPPFLSQMDRTQERRNPRMLYLIPSAFFKTASYTLVFSFESFIWIIGYISSGFLEVERRLRIPISASRTQVHPNYGLGSRGNLEDTTVRYVSLDFMLRCSNRFLYPKPLHQT